ncbi:MAG TPA: histidine kinase [Bryobacteraceae bacterium]|nr:histidine kinase [Bryobacteraceae bacterium]
MHPILQNWRQFLAWAGGWIFLGTAFGVVASIAGHLPVTAAITIIAPVALVLSFVCLSPFYICRAMPLRSSSPWKLLRNHLPAAVIVSGAMMLIARLSAMTSPGSGRWLQSAAPAMALVLAMLYLLSVALHYAFLEVEASRTAEILAREAQLKALKAQVNPHFLFNSLNSISALTTLDPAKAREMCVRLADFLRLSLQLGERVTIPFAEELALTNTYLDVEQVRFGGKLRLRQDVDAACCDVDIPALLIQPLVENAVKHGIAMMAEGGEIRIASHRDRDWMHFTITNPFDPEAPSTGRNGLGLRNIRERLESRYGDAARMEVKVEECLYRVALTLPARIPR